MYKRVETDKVFYTKNGSDCTPFVTLADEYGGRVQIASDDGCYVLYTKEYNTNRYASVKHWFPEAARELKKLPDDARRMRRFDSSGHYLGMRQSYTVFNRILDIANMLKKFLGVK